MSDTAIPRADVKWRHVGIGLSATRLCMGCDCKRETLGGRGVGPRWRCVACMAKRAKS